MKNRRPLHPGDVALLAWVLFGAASVQSTCSPSSSPSPPAADAAACIPAAGLPPHASVCVPQGSPPCCPGGSCQAVPGGFACLPAAADAGPR